MARLGDVCEILNGYAFKSEYYVDSGIRIIRIANVQKGYIEDNTPVFYPAESKEAQKYTLYDNDLLMSLTGNVGRVAFIQKEFLPAALNQRVACLRIKDQTVISKAYLFHFFNSDHFEKMCIASSKGVAQKNMSTEWLKDYFVSLPPREEQHKIASILDKLIALISLRKQQLAKLDALVKARFVEMFGDPLRPSHSKLLGDVALLERGRFSPRPRNDPRYYGGNYPFIQTGDIANCGHRLSNYRQTLNEKGICVSKKFTAGTIVIAIVGATIGATAILEIDIYAPDSVIGISVDKTQYNNVFMEMLLQFWQPELLRIAPESARANINLTILQNIPIVDAGLELQNQFAAFAKQVDKSKLTIRKSLDELETLKKSLMQKYFG